MAINLTMYFSFKEFQSMTGIDEQQARSAGLLVGCLSPEDMAVVFRSDIKLHEDSGDWIPEAEWLATRLNDSCYAEIAGKHYYLATYL